VFGQVFSASVSILKLPQHPFGDPPQMPPLPFGGICDGFKIVSLDVPIELGDEEAVLVDRMEQAVDGFEEEEMGTTVDRERIVDVRVVEMARRVDTRRNAEGEALTDKEARVGTVSAVETDCT